MQSSSNDDYTLGVSPPIVTREETPPPTTSQLDHRQAFYNFSMSRTSPAPFVNPSSPRPREIQNSPPIDVVTTVVKTCKHCSFPFRATPELIAINQEYCSKECRVCHQWFMKPSISLDHVPLRQPTAQVINKGMITSQQASSAAVVPNGPTRPAPLSRQISLPENLTDKAITSAGNLLTLLTKPTQIPSLPLVTSNNPTNTTTTNNTNVISIPSTITVPVKSIEKIKTAKTEIDGDTCIGQEDTINLFSQEQLSSKEKLLPGENSFSHSIGKEKGIHHGKNIVHKVHSSQNKHPSPNTMKNKLLMEKIGTSSKSCSNELLRSHPPTTEDVPYEHGQESLTFTVALTPTPPRTQDVRNTSGGVGTSIGRFNHTPTSPSTSELPTKTESSQIEISGTNETGNKSRPKSPHESKINSTNSDEFSDEFSDPMGLEGDRVHTWRDRHSDAGSCNNSTKKPFPVSGGIFMNIGPTVPSSNKPFIGTDRVATEVNDSSIRMSSAKSGVIQVVEGETSTSPRLRVNFKEMATSAAEWLFTPKQPKSRQRPQLHLYY